MTDRSRQSEKAAAFRRMHDRSRLLLLPNAWDAASARVFEEVGIPALATTSAGVAWVLGHADGEATPRAEMADMVRRIASAVGVPVTADMEAGYGPRPEDAAATAQAVIDAGAVGMNLEDGIPGAGAALFEVSAQVERIRAVRETAANAGVEIVLNARTDVFLAGVGEPSGRLAHAVKRANAYREAGADCLFVPGVRDVETIAALAREIAGPLNILAVPGIPPAAELARLGVARVSVGSGIARTALTLARRAAQEMCEKGTFSFLDGSLTHAEVNALVGH